MPSQPDDVTGAHGVEQGAGLRGERVRLAAARMFVEGVSNRGVAEGLRVSLMSVSPSRRAFDAGGVDALASKGPGGARCKLSDAQLQDLAAQLEAGPPPPRLTAGPWLDQARTGEVVAPPFRAGYTP